MISAKIVACTRIARMERMYTFLLTFPTNILAEVNTYRKAARNTSSLRAIPTNKVIENASFIPDILFKRASKGMSVGEPLFEEEEIQARKIIENIRKDVIKGVDKLTKLGLAKEQANRYLSPFNWTKQVFTILHSDLLNIFAQRLALHKVDGLEVPQADISFYTLALKMREAVDKKVFTNLDKVYHIPLVSKVEKNNLELEDQIILSIARCANVSYTTVGDDNFIDVDRASKIVDKLLSSNPRHYSPFEHQVNVEAGDRYTCFGKRTMRVVLEEADKNLSFDKYVGIFKKVPNYRIK